MMRGTIRQTIGAAALAALLPLLCVSCSEDGISTASIEPDGGGTVTVGLTLYAAYGNEVDGYEAGSEYENYLNIPGGDYRIYFFTNTAADGSADDTFIAQFNPDDLTIVPVEGSNYTQYTMVGEVPDELLASDNGNGIDFKVVMLANWGTNNYPEPTEGTKISDLWEDSKDASKYTFTHLEDFNLSPTGNLIPFYGVHAYSGVQFKENQATILDAPLTLLRAMAKVEVIFLDDYQTLNSVKIQHYNNKGYCAPAKVYSETDYDSGYTDWDNDFETNGLHLVGNANDGNGNPEEKSFDFEKVQEYSKEGSTTNYETWMAYVPEYSNTTVADDYSYIKISVGGETYPVYFAQYDDDGTTNNSYDDGDRYDIERNYLYRFYVALHASRLQVHVNKWDTEYENEYTFGTSTGTGSGTGGTD